jgi:hypothetical protein
MRLTLLTAILFVVNLTQALFAQNTFTVNNNPGSAANYHTLQGALDSVPAGAILLLQASAINYGNGTIKKPVVIYGPGYLLGQNNAPFTQANLTDARVERLFFVKGSDGSIASGITLEITTLNDGSGNRFVFDSTNNVTVSRCKIRGAACGGQGCRAHTFVANNSSNVNINQSYIPTEGFLLGGTNFSMNFKNNIINGLPYLNFVGYASNFTATFQNNSMYGRLGEVSFANCTFVNNVIITPTANDTRYIDAGMAHADHNVSNVDIFPAGGTNINNADGTNTYVLTTNPAISSDDGIFQLKPGSVAIGYGNDGKDAGASGGNNPYVLSGIPAIPNIYFANPQQVGTTTGGLKIQLKIKANN